MFWKKPRYSIIIAGEFPVYIKTGQNYDLIPENSI